ncbi:DUF1565 domain-containing protein [Solitalea lacus]|uniref:DUF1565 domain-containing protein n=1 Tax=Solitalea lacus TaxID=2911172 RepID=UPI001EDC607D|nr:DUF1565 domain-containing protein [Solitalea lacus]UKJ07961.1 DUF1565 domain-containing protein [Solitalea lacus]
MKKILIAVFALSSFSAFAKDKSNNDKLPHAKEYHVSVNGSDKNDGSLSKPFKTITAASNVAVPGDVITVHAGIYREQITPPRGGNSDQERIVYQAAKGEKVEIKGSEIIKGWKKLENDTWVVKIPNSFFGKFNPYSDTIHGDWFWPKPKERKYHTGAVYLKGDWLMEAENKDEVMQHADLKNPLWWAEVDSTTTTLFAQFKYADPNRETVEINVRQTVFYPKVPYINFITVRGFTMEHAATNWASCTAEQKGLLGTHWSKGWIIEDNIIQYSMCAGITLGKYGDKWDNTCEERAESYVATVERAQANGWNKSTVGSHVVRNNQIAYCEQVGIVGSMGCSFSTIEGNLIHDIFTRGMFSGAEMAGIKFHGAIDTRICNNHIYHTYFGIWLDWMAQGAQVSNNLLHENSWDLFTEVTHGPILISNNVMLSPTNLKMNASGVAFVHNLFAGRMDVITYEKRLTPYHKPHSTDIAGFHDNPGGGLQFINNLFVDGGNARPCDSMLLPVKFAGNVYVKGANILQPIDYHRKSSRKMLELPALQCKTEIDALMKPEFDAAVGLVNENGNAYLNICFDNSWLVEQKRKLVTTSVLGSAIIPNQPFEDRDGKVLSIDTDYLGNKRNSDNPSPGPFEIKNSGKQRIKLWAEGR